MILSLDVKTLIVVLDAGCSLGVVLLILDIYKNASRFDRLFTFGLVLQALAWALVACRGLIPDLFSFSIGNSLQFCGIGLQGIGLLSLKREIGRGWVAVYAASTGATLLAWWLPGIAQPTRILLMSAFYPVYFGVPGWILFGLGAKTTPLQRFLGLMLLVYSAGMAARGGFVFAAGSYSLASQDFLQVLVLLILVLVMILVNAGYVLVRKEQANVRLAAASEEKNLLLAELQHRVKNSLMMISSLTSLEMGRRENAEFRESMEKVRDRINAVAKLYDLLLADEPSRGVRLDIYVKDVAEKLLESYSSSTRRIAIEIELEQMEVDAKTSVSVGIIVNELVTNAMKYAFPGGRTGRIRVRLARCAGKIELEVADDGVGAAEGGATGLGSLIVSMLVKQLGGELRHAVAVPQGTVAVPQGTAVTIAF